MILFLCFWEWRHRPAQAVSNDYSTKRGLRPTTAEVGARGSYYVRFDGKPRGSEFVGAVYATLFAFNALKRPIRYCSGVREKLRTENKRN